MSIVVQRAQRGWHVARCGTKSYSELLLSLNFLSIHCTAACWSSDPLVGGVRVVVESRVREVDRDRAPPRVDPKPRHVAWVHFPALCGYKVERAPAFGSRPGADALGTNRSGFITKWGCKRELDPRPHHSRLGGP
jgi:hypothetical protein